MTTMIVGEFEAPQLSAAFTQNVNLLDYPVHSTGPD